MGCLDVLSSSVHPFADAFLVWPLPASRAVGTRLNHKIHASESVGKVNIRAADLVNVHFIWSW